MLRAISVLGAIISVLASCGTLRQDEDTPDADDNEGLCVEPSNDAPDFTVTVDGSIDPQFVTFWEDQQRGCAAELEDIIGEASFSIRPWRSINTRFARVSEVPGLLSPNVGFEGEIVHQVNAADIEEINRFVESEDFDITDGSICNPYWEQRFEIFNTLIQAAFTHVATPDYHERNASHPFLTSSLVAFAEQRFLQRNYEAHSETICESLSEGSEELCVGETIDLSENQEDGLVTQIRVNDLDMDRGVAVIGYRVRYPLYNGCENEDPQDMDFENCEVEIPMGQSAQIHDVIVKTGARSGSGIAVQVYQTNGAHYFTINCNETNATRYEFYRTDPGEGFVSVVGEPQSYGSDNTAMTGYCWLTSLIRYNDMYAYQSLWSEMLDFSWNHPDAPTEIDMFMLMAEITFQNETWVYNQTQPFHVPESPYYLGGVCAQ